MSQEEGSMAADVAALIATLVQLSELGAVCSSNEVAMQHVIYAQGRAARTLTVCLFIFSHGLRRPLCGSSSLVSYIGAF